MTRSHFKDSRRPYFWCERALLELGLTTDELAIYCLLAAHANEKDQCWPSYQRMASQLGICRRTAIRAVNTLSARGLLRKRTLLKELSRTRINLYELCAVPPQAKGGDCGTPPLVTVEHQEQGTIKQGVEGGGRVSNPDGLLDLLSEGFLRKHGHRPTYTKSQLGRWAELRRLHPEPLLTAKIAAWWEYPLPATFRGNRTFGAFLQWFDDISLNGSGPAPGRVLTDDELRTALHEGTPLGQREFRELVGTLAEDAQIRLLLKEGLANDEDDARVIIAACRADASGA